MSGFADNVRGDPAHLSDRGLQLARHGARGKLPPGQLGYMNGKIAGALEVGGNAKAGRERTQVACDGLLTRDQIDSSPVDVLAEAVDSRVDVDHTLGGAKVGVQ